MKRNSLGTILCVLMLGSVCALPALAAEGKAGGEASGAKPAPVRAVAVGPATPKAKAAEPTGKLEPKPTPQPAPKPKPPAGPCELENWREVSEFWKASRKRRDYEGLVQVFRWIQLAFTDEGDCAFPMFSPDGRQLAVTLSAQKAGRRSHFLRIIGLDRLDRAQSRLVDVQSAGRARPKMPIFRGRRGFERSDDQVYFSWVSPRSFIYYSRILESIFRGEYRPTARSVHAELVTRSHAITMHGSGRAVYYQDKLGIAPAWGTRRNRYHVLLGKSRCKGPESEVVEKAYMPAVCPRNPSIVAFIARFRHSSSSDLCVRFADGSIVRLYTPQGWEKLPSWSPDGGHIAFYSTRSKPRTNEYGIWVVSVDRATQRLDSLANVSGDDVISPYDMRDDRRTGGPAWTPGSKQILYFAKTSRRAAGGVGAEENEEDFYRMMSYNIQFGLDEGALPVKMPEGLKLNSPGDVNCSPSGGLIAFSNAETKGRRRDYRIILLLTNLPGNRLP